MTQNVYIVLVTYTLMIKWVNDNGDIKEAMLGDIKECAMHEKIKESVIETWTD